MGTVYFDLTGIVPTADEVETLKKAGYVQALERLLERGALEEMPYREFVLAALDWQQNPVPSRTRVTVSATAEQLGKVGRGETSRIEFRQQVVVRVFRQ